MGLSCRPPSLVGEQDTALKALPCGPRSGIPLAAESGVGITSGRTRGTAVWAGLPLVHKVGGKDHHSSGITTARGGIQMAAAGAGSGAPPGAGTEPLAVGQPSPGAGTDPVAAGRASSGGARSVLGALVSPRTWLAVIHLLAGLVLGLVAFLVVVVGISLGIGLMPLFLVGIPVLVGVIWLAGLGARTERVRFAVLLGVDIPEPAPLPDEPRGWRRMNLLFLARSTWLPTVYALLRLPLSAIQAVVVTVVWGLGLALIALPAYNGALPGGSAHMGSFALNNLAWVALGVVTGVALLLSAPWLTRVLAAEDAAVARWLLGPGRRDDLT